MKKRIAWVLSLSLLCVSLFGVVEKPQDVRAAALSITQLDYSSKTVKIGKKFELNAFTTPYECDELLVWSSSDTKVVDFEGIDHRGDDMDFIAKKAGKATITCRLEGTNSVKTCAVTVKKAGSAKIIVDDAVMDIEVGEWEDIEAQFVGGNFTNRKLTYTVANKKIAKVKNGRVYGKKNGTTKITIRAKAKKSVKKTIRIIVEYDD